MGSLWKGALKDKTGAVALLSSPFFKIKESTSETNAAQQ